MIRKITFAQGLGQVFQREGRTKPFDLVTFSLHWVQI